MIPNSPRIVELSATWYSFSYGSRQITENLDLNLDSTPIIEWLAKAHKEGKLDRDGLRRSLIYTVNQSILGIIFATIPAASRR